MIKLILDTNVLMSGIFWSGPPAKLLDAWQRGNIKLIISPEILDEYVRVADLLSMKYPGVDVTPIIDLITVHSILFMPEKLPEPVSQDPDDDKFIATAIAANCKLIVSGDKDLLNVNGFNGINIIKPGSFISNYLAI